MSLRVYELYLPLWVTPLPLGFLCAADEEGRDAQSQHGSGTEEQLRRRHGAKRLLEGAQHLAGLGLGGLKTTGPAKITVEAAKVILILFAASTLNASSLPAEDAVSLGHSLIQSNFPNLHAPLVSPILVTAFSHLPARVRQRQH